MVKPRWWVVGLLIAVVAAILSPLASASPDGLERVAEELGFIQAAGDASFNLISDYAFPGVGNEALATLLAGIVGTLLVFGLASLLGLALKNRESH